MNTEYEYIYQITDDNAEQLLDLYRGESWSKNRSLNDVKKMLEKSWVISIIDSSNGNMIAFARVITDFVYRAFIYDVIVARDYRKKGFGKLIVEGINNHPDIINVERIELNCIDSNIPFYQKIGFDRVPNGTNMMRYYR
jgi:predicted GNAT family N-acyltransferase